MGRAKAMAKVASIAKVGVDTYLFVIGDGAFLGAHIAAGGTFLPLLPAV